MSSACTWVFLPAARVLSNPILRGEHDDHDIMTSESDSEWVVVGRSHKKAFEFSASPQQSPAHRNDGQNLPHAANTGCSPQERHAGRHSGRGPWEVASVRPTTSAAVVLHLLPQTEAEVSSSTFYDNLDSAMSLAEQRYGETSSSRGGAWAWERVQDMVCYGLGSLGSGLNPRYQLALARLLAKRLSGLAGPPEFFDPVFSCEDRAALQRLGCVVTEQDEGGARRVQRRTLFYMPHCEAELTDALLAANWGPGQLSQLVIIGNSFSTYAERWSLPTAQRSGLYRPDFMLALCNAPLGCLLEIPARDAGFPVASAFNDMSVHMFPAWHPALDKLAAKA